MWVDDFVQDMLECVCWKWVFWCFGILLWFWLLFIMYNLYVNQLCDWYFDEGYVNLDDLFEFFDLVVLVGECLDFECVLVGLLLGQCVVLLLVVVEEYIYVEVVGILGLLVGIVMLCLYCGCEQLCQCLVLFFVLVGVWIVNLVWMK